MLKVFDENYYYAIPPFSAMSITLFKHFYTAHFTMSFNVVTRCGQQTQLWHISVWTQLKGVGSYDPDVYKNKGTLETVDFIWQAYSGYRRNSAILRIWSTIITGRGTKRSQASTMQKTSGKLRKFNIVEALHGS